MCEVYGYDTKVFLHIIPYKFHKFYGYDTKVFLHIIPYKFHQFYFHFIFKFYPEKLKEESLLFTEAKVPAGFSGWRNCKSHSSRLYSPAQVTTII